MEFKKLSEAWDDKIFDAWGRATFGDKVFALCDYLHQQSGFCARLWLDTDPNAERIIWATLDSSENEIHDYGDSVVMLAKHQTHQFADFGEADSLEEYIQRYEIPSLEMDMFMLHRFGKDKN